MHVLPNTLLNDKPEYVATSINLLYAQTHRAYVLDGTNSYLSRRKCHTIPSPSCVSYRVSPTFLLQLSNGSLSARLVFLMPYFHQFLLSYSRLSIPCCFLQDRIRWPSSCPVALFLLSCALSFCDRHWNLIRQQTPWTAGTILFILCLVPASLVSTWWMKSASITTNSKHMGYQGTVITTVELAISIKAEFHTFFRGKFLDDEIHVNCTTCYINRHMNSNL